MQALKKISVKLATTMKTTMGSLCEEGLTFQAK